MSAPKSAMPMLTEAELFLTEPQRANFWKVRCDIAELIEAAQDVIEWYAHRDEFDEILAPDKQGAQMGRLMEAIAKVWP